MCSLASDRLGLRVVRSPGACTDDLIPLERTGMAWREMLTDL
jgi:hypothetical protein